MNEVTKLCYEVSEADVARARNQLKASLLFLQDSSQRTCWGGGGGEAVVCSCALGGKPAGWASEAGAADKTGCCGSLRV